MNTTILYGFCLTVCLALAAAKASTATHVAAHHNP
jgi:hypothetical protein